MKLVCLLVLGALAALPQQLVLRAARLFDGRSDTLQTPGIVVIEEGRIVGVGPTATVKPGGSCCARRSISAIASPLDAG